MQIIDNCKARLDNYEKTLRWVVVTYLYSLYAVQYLLKQFCVAAKALHLLKPVGMIFHNIITFGEILYLWRVDPDTWSLNPGDLTWGLVFKPSSAFATFD